MNPNGEQAAKATGDLLMTMRVASFSFDVVRSGTYIHTIQVPSFSVDIPKGLPEDEILKKLRDVLCNLEISCVSENHHNLKPKQVQGATEEPQGEITLVRNQTARGVSPEDIEKLVDSVEKYVGIWDESEAEDDEMSM